MVGRVISHYRLIEKIGEGGMGILYLAEDLTLRRRVALKFLPEGTATDPQARARFEREARAAAALFHPNICPVHEIGESESRLFIVMAYIEGESLAERLRRGALPLAEAITIVRQVAMALGAAHTAGFVHRDVKPSNVLLARDGRAVLLDFGIAKMPDGFGLTTTGAMLGTLAYMAPEQVQGKVTDARSDLWSLGVMLHELVTGHLPYHATDDAALLYAIVHQDPEIAVTGPPALLALLGRALARNPDKRYASAEQFLADLDALERGDEVRVRSSRPRPRRRTVLLAAAILVLVAAGAWLGALRRPGAPRARGLAVLPLENLSGDPGQEYLADGMTDELINEMSQVGGLKVIARSSVMRYKGSHEPLRNIARALGVETVIEGAVLRARERFRINAQLVEARSSRNLWAHQYEGQFSDALAMQDDVARAIVREIRVTLTPAEAARLAHTAHVDPRAHDAYLLGRYEWNKQTQDGGLKSIEHYRRALMIDPGYALAYIGLADSYYTLSNFFLPPDSAMPMVRLAAIHAAALDSTLGDAHTLIGVTYAQYDWLWELAEKEYRKALELNPNADTAHRYYGYYLVEMGRWDEARREFRLAIERDPGNLLNRWLGAWPDFYQARYDSAIVRLVEIVNEDSSYALGYSLLGESFEMKGSYENALRALRTGEARGGNPWVRAAEARVLARMGRVAEARRQLAALEHSASKDLYVSPYALASGYAILGDRDRAFALLERGIQERCEDLPLLNVDPRMTALRADPRFGRMVIRLGLVSSGRTP